MSGHIKGCLWGPEISTFPCPHELLLPLEKSRRKSKFAESMWEVGGSHLGCGVSGESFWRPTNFPHWRRFNVTQQWWWVTLTTLDWGHQGKAFFSSQIVFKGPYTAIEILEQRPTSITDNVTIPHCKQGTHWDCQQPRGHVAPTSPIVTFTAAAAHLLRRGQDFTGAHLLCRGQDPNQQWHMSCDKFSFATGAAQYGSSQSTWSREVGRPIHLWSNK